MNKTTLFLEFENGKAILPIDLSTSIEKTQKMVTEFEKINMGSVKKIIAYGTTQYTVPQFNDYFRNKLLTPEQRDIEDLKDRVSKLEDKFLTKLKPPKVMRDKRGQEAIRNFHARIEGGEDKANKINRILEISGFKLAPLSAKGFTAFGSGQAGEVRCIVYLEDMYDEIGESKFTEIITAVSTISDVFPKQLYFIAIRYAIESKKMRDLNAAIAAEAYFKMDYVKLTEALKVANIKYKEQTGVKISNLGIVLGKVLTGEIKIDL